MRATSIEYVERLEDEIAEMITAKDDVDELRHDYRLLHKRGGITDALYRDRIKRLDRIAVALSTGKANTGVLRNGGAA